MKRFCTTLACLLVAGIAVAQPDELRKKQIIFDQLSEDQSLSQRSINCWTFLMLLFHTYCAGAKVDPLIRTLNTGKDNIYRLRNLWTKKSERTTGKPFNATIASYDVALFRLYSN